MIVLGLLCRAWSDFVQAVWESFSLTSEVPCWCSWDQLWYFKCVPVWRRIEGEMAFAKRAWLSDSANMPERPRMNNFRNDKSTSELNTQTWAECDVMSAHDLISMLLERKGLGLGFSFQLMGIWYLSLLSTCWKSYCEAYLLRHAFRKKYFCLGCPGRVEGDFIWLRMGEG